MTAKEDGGTKYSQLKNRLSLLSPVAIAEVAAVLTFGAKKYDAHNWRKGIPESVLMDAALRHIFAYLGGELFDRESGLPHLAHASCELMFLQEQRHTHPDHKDHFQFTEEYREHLHYLLNRPLD